MAEYYELVLTHRVQDGGRYDPHLEQPIIVKGFISPLMQRSVNINAEREALIDEMCHKIKDYWMQARKKVTAMAETKVFDLRKAARDEVRRAVAEILPGCMDTISRKAALTALNGCTEIFLNNLPTTIYKTDAVEAVTALPPAQQWVPCSTALPEHDGEYLVTINALTIDQAVYAEIDIARYKGGKWRKGFPVVAWQPLPEPWKGGQ